MGFLFQFHFNHFSQLWRLFCIKNVKISGEFMQFLNPRCSAALKKAGPIVDKLAPKFRETLKFLKKIGKFQGLRHLISNLSTNIRQVGAQIPGNLEIFEKNWKISRF